MKKHIIISGLMILLGTSACSSFKPDHPQVYKSFKERKTPYENQMAENGDFASDEVKKQRGPSPYVAGLSATIVPSQNANGAAYSAQPQDAQTKDTLFGRISNLFASDETKPVPQPRFSPIEMRNASSLDQGQGSADDYSYYDLGDEMPGIKYRKADFVSFDSMPPVAGSIAAQQETAAMPAMPASPPPVPPIPSEMLKPNPVVAPIVAMPERAQLPTQPPQPPVQPSQPLQPPVQSSQPPQPSVQPSHQMPQPMPSVPQMQQPAAPVMPVLVDSHLEKAQAAESVATAPKSAPVMPSNAEIAAKKDLVPERKLSDIPQKPEVPTAPKLVEPMHEGVVKALAVEPKSEEATKPKMQKKKAPKAKKKPAAAPVPAAPGIYRSSDIKDSDARIMTDSQGRLKVSGALDDKLQYIEKEDTFHDNQ